MFFKILFGDNTAVVRPVPIPNTAVKHCRADGSSPIGSARVGRRHSFIKSRSNFASAFFISSGPESPGENLRKFENFKVAGRNFYGITQGF